MAASEQMITKMLKNLIKGHVCKMIYILKIRGDQNNHEK